MKKDLMDRVEEKFGRKAANVITVIIVVILFAIFVWAIAPYWDEIDFFQGRGGNPQESYLEDYYE